MPALILRSRYKRPPVTPVLEHGHPLLIGVGGGVGGVVLPPYPVLLGRAKGFNTAGASNGFPSAAPYGNAFRFAAAGTGIILATPPDTFIRDGSQATFFCVRRCHDTTGRQASLFGYVALRRIQVHCPFNDGNAYWDFSNGTGGSGRLITAFTKTTNVEVLVFIADAAAKGREIWRDGTRIASSPSTAATWASEATGNFFLGAAGTVQSDNEDIHLWGYVARAWSDSEVMEFSSNPWQIFQRPRRIYSIPAAGVGGGGAVRPVVFIAT